MGTRTPAPAGPRRNTPFPVNMSKDGIIFTSKGLSFRRPLLVPSYQWSKESYFNLLTCYVCYVSTFITEVK